MHGYAEMKSLVSQVQQLFISSFELANGTIITPLILFYLELGIVSTKIYPIVE